MPKSASARSDSLTDRATLDSTIAVLEKYFDLSADGYLCHTRDLCQILVTAAARCGYIEGVCNDLPGAPDGNTVRGHLNAQLTPEQIRELERETNRALRSRWPHWLWSQSLSVACDVHDEPYYGQSDETDPDNWVCRGEKRDGTTHFYRCATLYVIRHQLRLTLAVVFVHPDDQLVGVVKKLLQYVRARALCLSTLYADKGFCSIPIMRDLLKSSDLSVIIAAPIKGKQGGLRALCHGRSSYLTTHTFASAEHGELSVPVAVVRAFKVRRDGTRTATWLVYVLLRVSDSLQHIRKHYRRRFGIDTSYRLMEQVRARTTSPNAALRFLFMGLALVLINVWIGLQWTYLRIRGSGPRRVAHQEFTLDRLARFLSRAVEAIYGVVSAVDPPGVKSVIY